MLTIIKKILKKLKATNPNNFKVTQLNNNIENNTLIKDNTLITNDVLNKDSIVMKIDVADTKDKEFISFFDEGHIVKARRVTNRE